MKVKNLLDQKFGRLLVLERAPNPGTRKTDAAAYWKCKCDCGKEKIVRGYSLTTGKTKSCGCLNDECAHLNKYKLPKLSHEESVCKKLWKRRDRYIKIPFKNFITLIQQPCYYCGQPPSMVKYSNRKDGEPIYHGTLDRLDSNLDHTLDNVVPCCWTCNRAKLTRTVEQFHQYLTNLKNNLIINYKDYTKLVTIKPTQDIRAKQLIPIKIAYGFYKSNKPGDLTLDQFYSLSSSNCYYCGSEPSNIRDYYEERYVYNGLDRVDNSKGHSYDNVVPCCKYCNSAKNNLSLKEFLSWIERIKKF